VFVSAVRQTTAYVSCPLQAAGHTRHLLSCRTDRPLTTLMAQVCLLFDRYATSSHGYTSYVTGTLRRTGNTISGINNF